MEISSFNSFAANIVVQPDPAVRFIEVILLSLATRPYIPTRPSAAILTRTELPILTLLSVPVPLIPLQTFPPVTPLTLCPQFLTPASLHPLLRPSIPVRSRLPSLQPHVAQKIGADIVFFHPYEARKMTRRDRP